MNLDEYKSIETHWIAFYVDSNNAEYFDSFGVEYITEEIKNFIENNIPTNIYGIQTYDSIMRGYFWIDFMLNEKGLIEFTNLFSLSHIKHEKHDKIIHRYKKKQYKKRYIPLTAINIKNY